MSAISISKAMKMTALEQVAKAGKRGLTFEPGWESITLISLVDDGLVDEQIENGNYKFTLTEAGRDALADGQETPREGGGDR